MLSWNHFIRRGDISALPINEQMRLYYVYQNEYYYQIRYIQGKLTRAIEEDASFLLNEDASFLLNEDDSRIKL